jgi:ADP-dependent phosphofructokinase/glucokinase
MHAEHKTITHLELASIGDKNLMKKILDVVSSSERVKIYQFFLRLYLFILISNRIY